MERKCVPELPEAFEGLKLGLCQLTEPFLEIKHTKFFFVDTKHITIFRF